jgi:hypothetical protein
MSRMSSSLSAVSPVVDLKMTIQGTRSGKSMKLLNGGSLGSPIHVAHILQLAAKLMFTPFFLY